MIPPSPHTYKKLGERHIAKLQSQGCIAEHWDNVFFEEPHNLDSIHRVSFSGSVYVGAGCVLRDTELENVFLEHSVTIKNTGSIRCTKPHSGGIGTTIESVVESGGRHITISDLSTAQSCYMHVFYRHDTALQKALTELVEKRVTQQTSEYVYIATGTTIQNTARILNCSIGAHADICGAQELVQVTVCSSEQGKTTIGSAVGIDHAVISQSAVVDSSARLSHCFVGQGCRIGSFFSAQHSLLFANCEGFHSELCSVFAGPFTVTHHRSTLLIACYTSFFNAGSATNQSNHRYKLGPHHQGVFSRGTKTGSGSYVLYPVRTAPGSVVLGKHASCFDSGDFPFSYILEQKGETVCMPAALIGSAGLKRDMHKWLKRDRRKATVILDLYHPEIFSPYTVSAMFAAIACADRLASESSAPVVIYRGVKMVRRSLKRAIDKYITAISLFVLEQLAEKMAEQSPEQFLQWLQGCTELTEFSNWIDAAGFVVDTASMDRIRSGVINRSIDSAEVLHNSFWALYTESGEHWRQFAGSALRTLIARQVSSHPVSLSEQVAAFLQGAQKSISNYYNQVLADAAKEFEPVMHYGFGIDGSEGDDFAAVRGTVDQDPFCIQCRTEQIQKENVLAELVEKYKPTEK